MDKIFEVYGLTVNYSKRHIGLDSTPRFSWKYNSLSKGTMQAAYRIKVFTKEESMWDTGWVESSVSLHVEYMGKTLKPRTNYQWSVEIKDQSGNTSNSGTSFFGTGKLDEPWVGNWITADFIRKPDNAMEAPYFRRKFELEAKPSRAMLYICGLGYCRAFVNGEKCGDDELSTAFTRYDSTVLYMTYDVTESMDKGENVLAAVLGNGWYNCFAEDPWNTRQATWRSSPKFIAELHLEMPDGKMYVVASDKTWKSSKGPITYNGIRNGEFYDARLEMPGWNDNDFNDENWEGVYITRPPGGLLKSFEMQPIRKTMEFKPVRKWQTPSGTWVFDTGQNASGIARIKVDGKAGTEVIVRYTDILEEDGVSINQRAIGGFIKSGEFQTDKYIKKSNGTETWSPEFVYHGFQYVELEGLDYEPGLDAVTAVVMNTDFRKRGSFECSDELLNTVQRLCWWSTISNYHSIPTDCPHREKNGWTGDASISSEQTLLNFDPMAAYYKWMDDFRDAQKPNGCVPCVVPSTGWGYGWGNGPDWSSALTLIPWYTYLYTGDRNILARNYDIIKKHCDFMLTMADGFIVNYGIGDWCPPFEGKAISVNMSSFKAPTELTDTAYFYNTADIISRIAEILGHPDDKEKYALLAANIKKAFRTKFFDKKGMKVAGDCQTSTACMIFQGLAEEDEKEPLLELLISQIEELDWHLDFGILGNKYVMHTLGDTGNGSIGFRMLAQRTFPSPKRWIDLGATTLWECWNGGGSHNHHMFSDLSAFMYKYVGGISPDENKPGFRHINFRPAIDCGLEYAMATHDSLYGMISCKWTNKGEKVTIELEIPAGTTGTLYVPIEYLGKLKDGGILLKGTDTGNKACFTLESGSYSITN
ncbi:MAG TPA: family 78 glycoside hydrolase catalytic domain [Clostridia bacterium]|nr:family 78 glycoside hydrolase catalytic domain [Clostridia bacterium]HPQ47247.1 family 78 glycoside hydrolase catalytic domain [Clostridia bacterium]HRX41715.1 family 78 glycoside hydrolase catalytic domain [Clostridia bacterium]